MIRATKVVNNYFVHVRFGRRIELFGRENEVLCG